MKIHNLDNMKADDETNVVVLSYLWSIYSKIYTGYLKLRIVLNPIYTMLFPICTHFMASL